MASPLRLDPPLELNGHHTESLANLRDLYADDPHVVALLLGGSIAHGFAKPDADIDFMAVVTPAEYARRAADGRLAHATAEPCTYDGGYVDGKFLDVEFLRRVAAHGSEPARFAFLDARIVFSRAPELPDLLAEIVRYPERGVEERILRFAAQLAAWRWFYGEGAAKENRYLELLAVQKLVLFSCRIVLAANRMLYPYHKWVLRVTEDAPRRPPALMDELARLVDSPDLDRIDHLVATMLDFAGVDTETIRLTWGNYFLRDNELGWMTGHPFIDDL